MGDRIETISAKGSKGRGKKSKDSNARSKRSVSSVASWAKESWDGCWKPRSYLRKQSAGLVLLTRSGIQLPPTLSGTWAILVKPEHVSTDQAEADSESRIVRDLWDSLGLCGSIDDELRLSEEGPSGHFGRIGVVETDAIINETSSGGGIALASAIASLQNAGYRAVCASGANQRNAPEASEQLLGASSFDTEVLPHTCAALIGLKLPPAALESHAQSGNKVKPDSTGSVRVQLPKRIKALIASERVLVEQRSRSTDSIAEFRGLSLFVPREQLRPRPSTAPLADAALKLLLSRKRADAPRVLDLGVGSGAL